MITVKRYRQLLKLMHIAREVNQSKDYSTSNIESLLIKHLNPSKRELSKLVKEVSEIIEQYYK